MAWNPPATCANGHQLRYPNVLAAWTPCDCPKADGRPTGHDYVMCKTCNWEARSAGCDLLRDGYLIDPPHRGTGNPGDPGYPGKV